MESHRENYTHETGAMPVHDRYSWPWYVRAHGLGLGGVRGSRVTWPLDEDEYALMEARRNLEQVGQILRRLEQKQAEIVELRNGNRSMLARLVT